MRSARIPPRTSVVGWRAEAESGGLPYSFQDFRCRLACGGREMRSARIPPRTSVVGWRASDPSGREERERNATLPQTVRDLRLRRLVATDVLERILDIGRVVARRHVPRHILPARHIERLVRLVADRGVLADLAGRV